MNNKKLLVIAVMMIPFVVISFSFDKGETNFILDNNSNDKLESTSKDDDEIISGVTYAPLKIRVLVKGQVQEMELEEYIIGVVAGEMPASFDMEALKSQAVASRTYALYKKNNSNGIYDLTDNTNSQVYISKDDMRTKWGDGFDKYYNRVKTSVEETSGKVLTYNGEIIEAFYFAMSSGNTQEASTVFNESRDYLKSVESKYDNSSLKNYEVSIELPITEFLSKLSLTCQNPQIDYINYNDTGHVEKISVCTKEFKGTYFRTLLGLRSTNFTITIGEIVTITTKGYGHGVGMSQYGANGYASIGYTYEDILKHYYTGVKITDIKDV